MRTAQLPTPGEVERRACSCSGSSHNSQQHHWQVHDVSSGRRHRRWQPHSSYNTAPALAAALLLAAACMPGITAATTGGPPAAASGAGRQLQVAGAPSAMAGLGTADVRCAIVNQVHFHLEVVAGAMTVLSQLSRHAVDVYMSPKVMKTNWYGFMSWMGSRPGVNFLDCNEYDGKTTYDLVWFVTPERNWEYVLQTSAQMKPKVPLYMVHNGHLDAQIFDRIANLSVNFPLLTLAPHVARNISARPTVRMPPEWVMPIYKFDPAKPCSLQDLQLPDGRCLHGFSVQGRIEMSRRNYTEMWEQIVSYGKAKGSKALHNFRLNILGEAVERFVVPADVREYVAVYKNPPYPIFYDVVYHSYALVPMLASDLYYQSKFSSTVLTSLITGVPMIVDDKFLSCYTMVHQQAAYYQPPGRSELDVMFWAMGQSPEHIMRMRQGVSDLRNNMNDRATKLIIGWLAQVGLGPDAGKEDIKRVTPQQWPEVKNPVNWLDSPATGRTGATAFPDPFKMRSSANAGGPAATSPGGGAAVAAKPGERVVQYRHKHHHRRHPMRQRLREG